MNNLYTFIMYFFYIYILISKRRDREKIILHINIIIIHNMIIDAKDIYINIIHSEKNLLDMLRMLVLMIISGTISQ